MPWSMMVMMSCTTVAAMRAYDQRAALRRRSFMRERPKTMSATALATATTSEIAVRMTGIVGSVPMMTCEGSVLIAHHTRQANMATEGMVRMPSSRQRKP